MATIREFDEEWSKLMAVYTDKGAKEYLEGLYKRRFHWARPWTGTHFSAGAESTQRVEKAHHLIKRSLKKKKSSLMDVLDVVERRVASEEQTRAHINYRYELKKISPSDVVESHKCFSRIMEENLQYLGEFGQFQMKKEMAQSFNRVPNVGTISL